MRAVLQDVVVIVGRQDGVRIVVGCGGRRALTGCGGLDLHLIRCRAVLHLIVDNRDFTLLEVIDVLIDGLLCRPIAHDICILVDFLAISGICSGSTRLIDTRQQGLRLCLIEDGRTIPIGQAVDIDIVLFGLPILTRNCCARAGRIRRSVHCIAIGAVARDGDRRCLGRDGEGAVVDRQPACRRLDAGIFCRGQLRVIQIARRVNAVLCAAFFPDQLVVLVELVDSSLCDLRISCVVRLEVELDGAACVLIGGSKGGHLIADGVAVFIHQHMGVHIIAYRTIAIAADDLGRGRTVSIRLVDAVCCDSSLDVAVDIAERSGLCLILGRRRRALSRRDIRRRGRRLSGVARDADVLLIDLVCPVFTLGEEILIGILDLRLRAIRILDRDGLTRKIPGLQIAVRALYLFIFSRRRIHADQRVHVRCARIRILQAVGTRAVIGVVELGLLDGQRAAVVDGVVLVRSGQAGDLLVGDIVDACVEVRVGRHIAEEVLQVISLRRICAGIGQGGDESPDQGAEVVGALAVDEAIQLQDIEALLFRNLQQAVLRWGLGAEQFLERIALEQRVGIGAVVSGLVERILLVTAILIGHADVVAPGIEDIAVDTGTVDVGAHVDGVDDEDGLRVHEVAVLGRPDGGVVVGILAGDTIARELVVGQLDILARIAVKVRAAVEIGHIVRLEVVRRAVVVECTAQRCRVEERRQERARLILVDGPGLIGRTGRQDSVQDDCCSRRTRRTAHRRQDNLARRCVIGGRVGISTNILECSIGLFGIGCCCGTSGGIGGLACGGIRRPRRGNRIDMADARDAAGAIRVE